MIKRSVPPNLPSLNWRAALAAGIVAGTVATAAQVILWWTFTDDLPEIFFRDTRLTAAILLGQSVLPPPATSDRMVILVAGLIHVLLSMAYGLALACVISRLTRRTALLAGCVFGLILYAVNMHIVTNVYPWFSPARDWITVVTHVIFGISLAAIYKALSKFYFA